MHDSYSYRLPHAATAGVALPSRHRLLVRRWATCLWQRLSHLPAARTRLLLPSFVTSRTLVIPSPFRQGEISKSSTRRQRRGRRQRMSPSWCMLRQLRQREALPELSKITASGVSPIVMSQGQSRQLLLSCRALIADGE